MSRFYRDVPGSNPGRATKKITEGRATRLATGAGWKPVELCGLAGSTPAPSAELLTPRSVSQHGVRSVAVSARLPVKQKVRVRLPSVTL